jgi:hypothetical protein
MHPILPEPAADPVSDLLQIEAREACERVEQEAYEPHRGLLLGPQT